MRAYAYDLGIDRGEKPYSNLPNLVKGKRRDKAGKNFEKKDLSEKWRKYEE